MAGETAMTNGRLVWGAAILGAGIALAGWFIGEGFVEGRTAARVVTVKGVAERDVEADIALWPLNFVATNDDLAVARDRIRKGHEAILAFLERHGIDPAAAEVQKLDVNDLLANPYRSSGPLESRYIITETLMVRTQDPVSVHKASQDLGELVDAGVVLSSSGGPGAGPTFLFTGLNALKPAMIAEATAEARRAAEQFAKDSDSRIGNIRRANQGVFVILPRDQAPGIMEGSQLHKTLRVVSTVEYILTD
jgi:hypothetical protein